ncbi:hypothetical protein M426DRAFT_321438 [Hypoxylon sp. CI-4A]|nr:hypothetical protein M426DRAFT_321438 [Hypoxylon sp. CI-4A]
MPETIYLPHKPDTPLSYHFVPGQGPLSASHLLVFLNGLIGSQTVWEPTIQELQRRWDEYGSEASYPSLLAYDRYGQGESGADPADEQHGGSHDIQDVCGDLGGLIEAIWDTYMLGAPFPAALRRRRSPNLIFVANSIGCVIARLYAADCSIDAYLLYAKDCSVDALLLLDSNIANSDLVSIFPDPDAADFDPSVLPPDVTIADLRRTREGYARLLHPSVPNSEHLDRRNVASYFPYSDRPPLKGGAPGSEKGPWITVVGHDWDTFAEEGLRGSIHVPKSLTNAFMNPAWSRYNEGLTHLTETPRARGPLIANGCGHFIQKDDPRLVAELTEQLLEKIRGENVDGAESFTRLQGMNSAGVDVQSLEI